MAPTTPDPHPHPATCLAHRLRQGHRLRPIDVAALHAELGARIETTHSMCMLHQAALDPLAALPDRAAVDLVLRKRAAAGPPTVGDPAQRADLQLAVLDAMERGVAAVPVQRGFGPPCVFAASDEDDDPPQPVVAAAVTRSSTTTSAAAGGSRDRRLPLGVFPAVLGYVVSTLLAPPGDPDPDPCVRARALVMLHHWAADPTLRLQDEMARLSPELRTALILALVDCVKYPPHPEDVGVADEVASAVPTVAPAATVNGQTATANGKASPASSGKGKKGKKKKGGKKGHGGKKAGSTSGGGSPHPTLSDDNDDDEHDASSLPPPPPPPSASAVGTAAVAPAAAAGTNPHHFAIDLDVQLAAIERLFFGAVRAERFKSADANPLATLDVDYEAVRASPLLLRHVALYATEQVVRRYREQLLEHWRTVLRGILDKHPARRAEWRAWEAALVVAPLLLPSTAIPGAWWRGCIGWAHVAHSTKDPLLVTAAIQVATERHCYNLHETNMRTIALGTLDVLNRSDAACAYAQFMAMRLVASNVLCCTLRGDHVADWCLDTIQALESRIREATSAVRSPITMAGVWELIERLPNETYSSPHVGSGLLCPSAIHEFVLSLITPLSKAWIVTVWRRHPARWLALLRLQLKVVRSLWSRPAGYDCPFFAVITFNQLLALARDLLAAHADPATRAAVSWGMPGDWPLFSRDWAWAPVTKALLLQTVEAMMQWNVFQFYASDDGTQWEEMVQIMEAAVALDSDDLLTGIGSILSGWYHHGTLAAQLEDDAVPGTGAAATPAAAGTDGKAATAPAATATTTALAPASYHSRKVLVSFTRIMDTVWRSYEVWMDDDTVLPPGDADAIYTAHGLRAGRRIAALFADFHFHARDEPEPRIWVRQMLEYQLPRLLREILGHDAGEVRHDLGVAKLASLLLFVPAPHKRAMYLHTALRTVPRAYRRGILDEHLLGEGTRRRARDGCPLAHVLLNTVAWAMFFHVRHARVAGGGEFDKDLAALMRAAAEVTKENAASVAVPINYLVPLVRATARVETGPPALDDAVQGGVRENGPLVRGKLVALVLKYLEDAEALFRSLPPMLHTLNLADSELDDLDFIEALALNLPKSLVELFLAYNDIDEDYVAVLAARLPQTLAVLDLTGNEFGDLGLAT
ncbi:hypothetical protein H9P43_008776 [Blastocladiella emersonii ATCC 22665]|nr:hypothetical protein H9P43_008776 [Blastocladiella emersonii ATCC 22665]